MSEQKYSQLGENLVRLRQQRGFYPEELGVLTGMGLAQYQAAERGEVCPPMPAMLVLSELFEVPVDQLTGGEQDIRVMVLLENHSCKPEVSYGHGLSLHIKTPKHSILFDAGPDDAFVENAKYFGLDLAEVDTMILSHGHYDHGGGLPAFCRVNDHAPVYLREDAYKPYYAIRPDGREDYIGLPELPEEIARGGKRAVLTGTETVIDDELTLFAEPPMTFDIGKASGTLYEKEDGRLKLDTFGHEQSLLIRSGERAVLVAGCAHRGIVNILEEAKRRLGRAPDVVFGGFHLFELPKDSAESDALIDAVGRRLLEEKDTQYYTGHCTGDYAYSRLSAIMGDKLRPMIGGVRVHI